MRHLLSILAIALVPSLALAQLDCVVPTREEGFDTRIPGAESVRRAARAIEAIVKRNAVFMAGNEPVRVRTTITYHGDAWASASVITTAYNRKAWVAGSCQVSQFADRGGGLADGQIAVYINDADTLLGGRVGDSVLPARLAPRRVADAEGFPAYARTDDSSQATLLISIGNELPWKPVTIAEALDWREREVASREVEWRKEAGSADRGEAQLRAAFESMKKLDPANAEKMRERLERDIARLRSDQERAKGQANDAVARTRAGFDRYRASFSADQLRSPAFISGELANGAVQRVDDQKGRPIVRVDEDWMKRDPQRIKLLIIPQHSVATDEDHEWLVAARRALDHGAIAALVAR